MSAALAWLKQPQRLALVAGGVAVLMLLLARGKKALAYVQGKVAQVELAPVPGGKLMRADAAEAFTRMHAAAARAGVTLVVNSGFRSMEEQEALYAAYQAGTGNLAARPGYSNHQGGIAVDVESAGGTNAAYRWLEKHGASYGFKRTVPSEPWHWEYRPKETGAQV